MKRLFLGFLAAIVVAVATMAAEAPQTAYADHFRFLPNLPTVTQKRVLERGYGIYCLNQTADAYPDFRAQLQQVYQDEGERIGIWWYESWTGRDCDLNHYMVAGTQFPCGGGAVACIYYANDPVTIYYLRDSLYTNWRTTIGHEHGHWDGQHERYFDNKLFLCDANAKYTRMSCGTGVWWVTDYDLYTSWNVLVPDRPLYVGWSVPGNGFGYILWDQYRADCANVIYKDGYWNNLFDGGPAHMTCRNDVATRVAAAHSDYYGGPITWIGEWCGEEYDYCNTQYSQGWAAFYDSWGGCFYMRAENAILWWVPEQSAPEYWTFVGCF